MAGQRNQPDSPGELLIVLNQVAPLGERFPVQRHGHARGRSVFDLALVHVDFGVLEEADIARMVEVHVR